jgi:hypothetical protein
MKSSAWAPAGKKGCDIVAVLTLDESGTGANRDLQPSDLSGFDAVVHSAAASSSSPVGDLNPDATDSVHAHGSVHVAEVPQQPGCRASCSRRPAPYPAPRGTRRVGNPGARPHPRPQTGVYQGRRTGWPDDQPGTSRTPPSRSGLPRPPPSTSDPTPPATAAHPAAEGAPAPIPDTERPTRMIHPRDVGTPDTRHHPCDSISHPLWSTGQAARALPPPNGDSTRDGR